MPFVARSLQDCLADAATQGGAARLHHVFSEAPATILLPPMPIGSVFLERMPVRELPGGVSWRDARYEAFASPVFVLRDALVHSSAGILAVGDAVIEETLIHTSPGRHHYARRDNGIAFETARSTRLPGRHVAVLSGAGQNHFHFMMDCIARLAVLDDSGLAGGRTLLLPGGFPGAGQILDLLPQRRERVIHPADDETLLAEELVVPWTIHGQSCYHPCIKGFFQGMAGRVPAGPKASPTRLYLSRTRAGNRRLRNEAALIAALETCGFQAVDFETLDIGRQIALMKSAAFIVAPHGAGLANLVFAPPHAVVLELLMDSYANWCFRRLAAMLGLRYDCVTGQTIGRWSELSPAVHASVWQVSIPHVIAAVHQMTNAAAA